MVRRKYVRIKVEFPNGDKKEWQTEKESIEQHYRQLNFLTSDGMAVALNLAETRFVVVEEEDFDFNDRNRS